MAPSKKSLEEKLDGDNPLMFNIPEGFSENAVKVYDLKFGFLGTFFGRVFLTVVFMALGYITGQIFWSDIPSGENLVVPPTSYIPGIFFVRGFLFIPEAVAERPGK